MSDRPDTGVLVQVALDFVDLPRAIEIAREAVAGGVDWVEAGTPLIKAEGLDAVRELKAAFPDKLIFADLKTMDAGRIEVEYARQGRRRPGRRARARPATRPSRSASRPPTTTAAS